MRYISSNVIIAEVKNKLSKYFDSNLVDESIFYPRIKSCLDELRFDVYEEKIAVLEVENKQADLPEDFKRMCLALACFQEHCIETSDIIYTEQQHVCELNLCETACDVCHDDCGNMMKIVQKFPQTYKTWNTFDVLCLTKESLPFCDKNCFNFRSKSKNEIDIRNSKINTNFDRGLVYIEYVASLEGKTDFNIPDQSKIVEWIKADLIHEAFQTMYWNGETDILQRYQDTKRDLHIKYQNARAVFKLPEIEELYGLANKLINRYKVLGDAVWNDCIYTTDNNFIH